MPREIRHSLVDLQVLPWAIAIQSSQYRSIFQALLRSPIHRVSKLHQQSLNKSRTEYCMYILLRPPQEQFPISRTITPDQAPLSGQAKAKGAPRQCPELEHPTPFDAKVFLMTTNGGSAGQEMSEVFSFLSCEHKPAQAL